MQYIKAQSVQVGDFLVFHSLGGVVQQIKSEKNQMLTFVVKSDRVGRKVEIIFHKQDKVQVRGVVRGGGFR